MVQFLNEFIDFQGNEDRRRMILGVSVRYPALLNKLKDHDDYSLDA